MKLHLQRALEAVVAMAKPSRTVALGFPGDGTGEPTVCKLSDRTVHCPAEKFPKITDFTSFMIIFF